MQAYKYTIKSTGILFLPFLPFYAIISAEISHHQFIEAATGAFTLTNVILQSPFDVRNVLTTLLYTVLWHYGSI